MKFAWLQSNDTERHLCVVTPQKKAVALCNHPFLTGVRSADEATPECAECAKIWNSGKEISIVDDSGKVVVVRPKISKYEGGTLDPFFDVAQLLQNMGVAYCLFIGVPNQKNLRYWTNFLNYGNTAITLARDQFPKMLDAIEAKLAELKQEKPDVDGKQGGA